jgi:microcystin-dependent protein
MPWHTPDDISPPFKCWRVEIPASFVPIIQGMLLDLGFENQWEQVGTATPADCAQLGIEISNNFFECEGMIPIGGLIPYTSQTQPADFLLCDGSQYLRVDYPELYALLDPVFIVDPDNFVVPDLRERMVIGDGTVISFGTAAGNQTHTLGVNELPDHDVDIDVTNRSFAAGPINIRNAEQTATGTLPLGSFSGPNKAFRLWNPFLALNWLIRAL